MQVEVDTASGCEPFYEFDRFEKERDRFNYSSADKKTAAVFLNTRAEVRAMDQRSGTSAEAGIKYQWGGSEGNKVSGYVKGEAHDKHGNSAQIKIEQAGKGEGSITASGHYEKKQ